MTDHTLPGQQSLFAPPPPAEQRGQPTAGDWRNIRVRAKRIVHMMLQEGGWWSLAMVRDRCGGSDTGNSAAIRAARKQGYLVHTERRDTGVWYYKLQLPEAGDTR